MYNLDKNDNPAGKMLRLFTAKLDKMGVKYTVNSERHVIMLRYRGDHFKELAFTFTFDKDGKSVSLRVFSIAKFKDDYLSYAYRFCNKMNVEYRWIKFYVDKDNELTAAMDAVINPETVGEECFEILARAVTIVDDVYGKLNL